MFTKAKNIYIASGSFSAGVSGSSPLEAIHARASANAILNAGGRADEVKCHPGTRKEVLRRIEEWRSAQDSQTPPILWLSGPAGAGKTAIAQTYAEDCDAHNVPQANFFFFRTDPSRNSLSPLVATLMHQIILLYPSLQESVAAVLSTNPLILDSALETQLAQIIVTPLQAIQQSSSSYIPPLFVIDGLDECDSAQKLGQGRILTAFDNVLEKHPRLFRLLVASRDETQIQAAFKGISSRLLPLYLDDKYSPEEDIRTFVIAEFKRVQKVHPLAPRPPPLGAIWPSTQDVEDIVKKSSGQFIYAATVMRFILSSRASPTLSLARVQGAAKIATKSPFSYLDAIYEYILSEVDDQETLKNILHAELLIQAYKRSGMLIENDFAELLNIYDPKYSQEVIRSCLADMTPIIKYEVQGMDDDGSSGVTHRLLFHHASFPDYLLNNSRSVGYYVDIDAFNFDIQPAVWKGSDKLRRRTQGSRVESHDIALVGLMRLRQLPPRFLHTLRALKPPAFDDMFDGVSSTIGIFEHIHGLCVNSDGDMANYKQLLRQWIYTKPLDHELVAGRLPNDSEWPPCSRRYLAMAYVEHNITTEPHDYIVVALHPDTGFDAREIASWLTKLLRQLHGKLYNDDVQTYKRLFRKWMSWATSNKVPLDGPDSFPDAQWYHAMANNIERDITVEITLRPKSDSGSCEIAIWVNALLHRIYREKYRNSVQEYDRLLQKWVSWAIGNDIPLYAVDGLPKARWHMRRSRIEKWFARHLGLGSPPV